MGYAEKREDCIKEIRSVSMLIKSGSLKTRRTLNPVGGNKNSCADKRMYIIRPYQH